MKTEDRVESFIISFRDVYVFRTEFIEDHPESVEAFVNGVLQGLEFLKTNPDEGVAIASYKLFLLFGFFL